LYVTDFHARHRPDHGLGLDVIMMLSGNSVPTRSQEFGHEALPLVKRSVLDRIEDAAGNLATLHIPVESRSAKTKNSSSASGPAGARRTVSMIESFHMRPPSRNPGATKNRCRHTMTHQDRQGLRCIVGVAVVERDAHRSEEAACLP